MGEGTGSVQSRGEPGPSAGPLWGFGKATLGSCVDVVLPQSPPWDRVLRQQRRQVRPVLAPGLHLGHLRSDREGFWVFWMPRGAGAVFAYPAKHLNSNEQKGKNEPIRKRTVMSPGKSVKQGPALASPSGARARPPRGNRGPPARCGLELIFPYTPSRGRCHGSHGDSESRNDVSGITQLGSGRASTPVSVWLQRACPRPPSRSSGWGALQSLVALLAPPAPFEKACPERPPRAQIRTSAGVGSGLAGSAAPRPCCRPHILVAQH